MMDLTHYHLILSALKDAGHPYLQGLLANTPEIQHAHVKNQFDVHLNSLAEFCLNGYKGSGLLTTDFIKNLHRAIFPQGCVIKMFNSDGIEFKTLPGEYRLFQASGPSYLNPGQKIFFSLPEQISSSFTLVVNNINAKLLAATDILQKQDAIFLFLIDFLSIHPFADANGRVSCIMADLLAIRCGLKPFYFHSIKTNDKIALYQAIEAVQLNQDFTLAREMFLLYRKERATQ